MQGYSPSKSAEERTRSQEDLTGCFEKPEVSGFEQDVLEEGFLKQEDLFRKTVIGSDFVAYMINLQI